MIDECYRPNALLMKKLGIKINMNITQTMFDFFKENDALDVLEIYKQLGSQIEFVGSTAHHILAIRRYDRVLPEEIVHQERFINLFFGQSPKVFFPPEMAVDEDTEHLVASLGYKGMIVSGGKPNFDSYETTGVFDSRIKLFPHNNFVSAQFAFPVNGFTSDHDLNAVLSAIERYDLPVLFAFDHESFGGYNNPQVLHMKERFFEIAKQQGWEFVHLSELLDLPAVAKVFLKPTTWVGDFSKWDKMADRHQVIDRALAKISVENQHFIRKWILPSCHLHVDYATDLFWDYAKEAGVA